MNVYTAIQDFSLPTLCAAEQQEVDGWLVSD